jgi:glycosyltransferase involved in cell wall biosynthesis
MYKPIIVVPFYNHFTAFSKFAKKLLTLSYPILVVNDGSIPEETNKVKKLCKEHNFYYIELPKNQGKGGAVIAGMQYAIKNNYTHILQIDADGQHEYKDIGKNYIHINFKHDHNIYDFNFRAKASLVLDMINDFSTGIMKLMKNFLLN